MSRVRTAGSWIVLAGLLVAGALLWQNRTAVADDFRLLNYTAPADVAALSSKIGFTSEGQRYFYASHPQVEDKSAFNTSCANTELHATVLGCYVNYSIYVYDVTDTRLAGVQEVTSAHETLHAAYARLSDSERATVDAMLQRQYDAMAGNADFVQRFSVYDSLSQTDKLNELHSIFGTEVASLSSELETYYKNYFNDRSVVTGYYVAYQGQFDSLKAQQTSLKAEIESLKAEIGKSQSQYVADSAGLNADIQTFNQRANSGGYDSQAQFNADRAALVMRSIALTRTAQSINAKISQYNAAIQQYNELSIQTQDLQNSLDSKSVQSAPSV